MPSGLAVALLAGLGGMFGWGLADFFSKKSVDVVGPTVSLVGAHVFGSICLTAVAVGRWLPGPRTVSLPSAAHWAGFAGFGALQMLVYWLAYRGFEKGQLTILSPVFASYSGIVAVVSVVALGESASIGLIIALGAIFTGIIMLSASGGGDDTPGWFRTPGLTEVGMGALLAAFWTLGWNRFVGGESYVTTTWLMYLFMTAAAVILALFILPQGSLPRASQLPFMAAVGGCEAIAYLSVTWGFSNSTLTAVVALVSGAFALPTVVLAWTFLQERTTRWQTAAIGIIVLGVAAVAWGG